MALKISLIITWLAMFANLVTPFPPPMDAILFWGLLLMAAAHVGECFLFRARVAKAGGNPAMHYLQILVFGVGHGMTLPEA